MNSRCRRILYIEKPLNIGGSVISLYELVQGLDTNIYEPVVLFYGPNPYHEKFETLGIKVIKLSNQPPSPFYVVNSKRDIAASLSRYDQRLGAGYREAKQIYLLGRQDWPLALQVAQLLKNEAIDIVHHNNSLPVNRATVMAARMVGIPQVCHVRMLHRLAWVDKLLARFVNSFVYISNAVEEFYQKHGISPGKGQVVYNPIDVKTFEQSNYTAGLRAEFGLTDQDLLISNVGRLDWWKGHDYFLQAIAEVIRFLPNVKALIIGAPDSSLQSQAYYRRLQRLVTDLGLSSHVTFTGFRADVPHIMAASDIVVHSASEPEPFGRVIVEGMAAGRPVIATAAGGVLDIIEDQVTGLLVPPKNVTSMAQAIRRLLENQKWSELLGQRAQQYAKERFSVEQHVITIQCVYEKIWGSKNHLKTLKLKKI